MVTISAIELIEDGEKKGLEGQQSLGLYNYNNCRIYSIYRITQY